MKPNGRHPEKALTAIRVRNIKAPGRYADGNGLYLIVDKSGAKRWMLRTMVRGKRRDMGLGSVRLVTLAEAREKAAQFRKVAREGGDPFTERQRNSRAVPTFQQAADKVHSERSPAWKNRKHAAQWINTLRRYAYPTFGNQRVDQIETPDVLRALSPIWLTKPETARRVRQRIGVVLDWAKAAGFRVGDNPVEGVTKGLPKQPDNENHHAAMPYNDIPAFVSELRESKFDGAVKFALEFLILTGTRTNEVLGATWDEVDFESENWTIPSERMKASRAHRVPLADCCLEVLVSARKRFKSSYYVFPGRLSERPLSDMSLLMVLRRMDVQATVHGFRSSFRDWAAEQTNFPREVCEMALAHTIKNKAEASYRRGDLLEKRRRLMEAWSDFVSSNNTNIVSLKSAKIAKQSRRTN